MKFTSAILGAVLLAEQAIAHPGQSKAEQMAEIQQRNAFFSVNKRSLAHCAESLKARGNDVAMHARRSAMVEKLREKRAISQDKPFLRARDLESRDAEEVLNTNHRSNLTGITPGVDPSVIFAGNKSCILSVEVTEGPYWVAGELIRQDIDEGEEGVPLTMDIQIIDVNTCEPVPKAMLEVWHCNSTGVYSGVIDPGNGNPDDIANQDRTFMRGVQESDESGVVTFNTKYPGFYDGRTEHIHVLSHLNASVLPNNTVTGGSISHVGQIYFDQALNSLVEAAAPYNTNTQTLTTNAEDILMRQGSEGDDPVMEYVLLGDDVTDGIFAWISFGMNSSFSRDYVYNSWTITENGGVKNPSNTTWDPKYLPSELPQSSSQTA